jgi:membrane-bound lytic murein transglycosylase B
MSDAGRAGESAGRWQECAPTSVDRRRWLLAALALAAASADAASTRRAAATGRPADPPYSKRAEVQHFIERLVDEQSLPRPWLEQVLDSGRYSARVEKLMTPSVTPPPRDWARYRARALDAARLRDAFAYRQAHRETLARATGEFGVPAEIVVSIIGIETMFGRVTGTFRTLDALLTLAFDYPRRAVYYREELAHFLVLGHDGRIDVLNQTGSFAGAIGLPQFMPGSIRRYALDYDGDERIDLSRSPADAIGSVANYLHQQGWQRELPVIFNATTDASIAERLGHGISAVQTWAEVAELGVRIDGYLPPDTRVLLLDLPFVRNDGSTGVEYRLGTANLATILHYNRSYFYAAAVAEFADALTHSISLSIDQ